MLPRFAVRGDPRLAAFDNLAVLATYERPLLIIVGSKDAETPPILSRRLYEVSRIPNKTLVVASGKTHGDSMTSDEAITAYRKLLACLSSATAVSFAPDKKNDGKTIRLSPSAG